MGMSRERSDEVAHFVQGSLSIRSLELQTLDSLTLLLTDKLRIAGEAKNGHVSGAKRRGCPFCAGAIIDSKSWVADSGQPYFIAYGQATDSWWRPKMGMSRERSDEFAHFVQGSLSIRSPGLQTQDSLTLLLVDKLRIAGRVISYSLFNNSFLLGEIIPPSLGMLSPGRRGPTFSLGYKK